MALTVLSPLDRSTHTRPSQHRLTAALNPNVAYYELCLLQPGSRDILLDILCTNTYY
jgi:hypothetical protein